MAEPIRVLLHNSETRSLASKLSARFPKVEIVECNTYEKLPDVLKTFQPQALYAIRFAGTPGYPSDAMFAAQSVKWISVGGAGTDHLAHWDTSKVTVTNAAGAAADMMAEYVMGGFLHFMLDVPGLQLDKAARIWDSSRTVRPLKGKTLLIVGLGHTGQAIAARAKVFGMTVIGTRARPVKMDNVDEVYASDNLAALLPRADFIAVSTPLIAQTKGLLGKEEFAAMKDGVVIADVSRGSVIDQTALLSALQSGKVEGAALDVFETEPLSPESPFWDLENVLISPHCSSVHKDWWAASFDLFLDNLDRWIAGNPLRNVVDPDRGY